MPTISYPDLTCCCEPAGGTCCPGGDPPTELCIAFGTGIGTYNPAAGTPAGCSPWAGTGVGWFEGNSYTVNGPGGPGGCTWTYSAAAGSISGNPVTNTIKATLIPVGGGTAWFVTVDRDVGSLTFAYGHHFVTGPWNDAITGISRPACGSHATAPAVATCLPVTFADPMYGWYANSLFYSAAFTGGFTLSTGVCPSEGGDEGGGGGDGGPMAARRPAPVARPRLCLYAERVERLAGCSGFRCKHLCTIGIRRPGSKAAFAARRHLGESDIVLPSDECQDCPSYLPRL